MAAMRKNYTAAPSVYSSPIASNKSAGTFVGILKIEKT
jgi:hypothetical protein